MAGTEEARIGDACVGTHPSEAARAGCRGVPEPIEVDCVAPALIVHAGVLVACHVYVPVLIQPLPALCHPTSTQRKAFWSVQPFGGMRDTGQGNTPGLMGCAPWAALEQLCGSPCSQRRWAGRRAGSSARRGPWAAGAPATHGPSRGMAGSAHSQTPQLPRPLAASAHPRCAANGAVYPIVHVLQYSIHAVQEAHTSLLSSQLRGCLGC